MPDCFLAVGSNIDPESNIPAALTRLCSLTPVLASSTFYRTIYLDRPDDPPFLNGVWLIRTDLSPSELKFDLLRPLEAALGRIRSLDKSAPRTIDLDLILYADFVIDHPALKLPAPEIRIRPFVAVPLLELAPKLILPDTGEPLARLAVVRNPSLIPDPDLTAKLRAMLPTTPTQP